MALIDFTASRLVASEAAAGSAADIGSRDSDAQQRQQQVAFYDLSQDPEVFEGTLGDVQVGGQAMCAWKVLQYQAYASYLHEETPRGA